MSDTKAVDPVRAEVFPSGPGDISALASANAPTIVFDSTPFFGAHDGIGTVTLAARRHINAAGLDVVSDRILVCHLKGGLQSIRALKQSLETVIKIMEDHQRQMVSAARAYETICEALPPEPPPLKN